MFTSNSAVLTGKGMWLIGTGDGVPEDAAAWNIASYNVSPALIRMHLSIQVRERESGVQHQHPYCTLHMMG